MPLDSNLPDANPTPAVVDDPVTGCPEFDEAQAAAFLMSILDANSLPIGSPEFDTTVDQVRNARRWAYSIIGAPPHG